MRTMCPRSRMSIPRPMWTMLRWTVWLRMSRLGVVEQLGRGILRSTSTCRDAPSTRADWAERTCWHVGDS
eukprot:3191806-Amphidinium_carterae.1